MNILAKAKSLLSEAVPSNVASLINKHESYKYTPGLISIQYRLTPTRQAALEPRLSALRASRDTAMKDATKELNSRAEGARKIYDNELLCANAAFAIATDKAVELYEQEYRSLMIEFGKPMTPEELALVNTPVGAVVRLEEAKTNG